MTENHAVRLDQFLKFQSIVDSGGQAKVVIQSGDVLVNGEQETRRRRKLTSGDVIHFNGNDYPFEEPTQHN